MVRPWMIGKKIKNYEIIDNNILVRYENGYEELIKDLDKVDLNVLEEMILDIQLSQMKEKVKIYENNKKKTKEELKNINPFFRICDFAINIMCIATTSFIYPLASYEVMKEAIKEKKDIKLTKLYLNNLTKLQDPILIRNNIGQIKKIKITPNNIEEVSYKQLKKSLKNR